MNKVYKCICGKEFDNSQKFNGHKQGCELHIAHKYGSLKKYYEIKNRNVAKASETRIKNYTDRRIKALLNWISEKHTCEKCGKIMTEKFGSGRFCSRTCANSKTHSETTRSKIANTQVKHVRQQYETAPNKCVVCNSILPYEKRKRQTCSDTCYKALASLKAKTAGSGGLTDGCGSYSKHGKYKGIKCDSTYELVFLIYCLDHNISIVRNTKYFVYTFNNKERKYYPDFYLPNSKLYVELKGFKDDKVDLKLQAVKDSGNIIDIYFKQDLLPCFEYVGNTYNKKANPDYNNLEKLYDNLGL